jgi:hypothetical protein
MLDAEAEYVDGRSNPAILLKESIIETILLFLNLERDIVVFREHFDKVSLVLKQFDDESHHLKIYILNYYLMGMIYLLKSNVYIEDFLSPQLMPDELYHILVLFIDGKNAARMNVSADGVDCSHLSPNT